MNGFRESEMYDTSWLYTGFSKAVGRREMIPVERIFFLWTCFQYCEHHETRNSPEMDTFRTISLFWKAADDEKEQGRAREQEMICV